MTSSISKFIKDQLSVWPLASSNFRSLKRMKQRSLEVGGLGVKLQFNPCRIASSTAETDARSLEARPCFLCEEHRPPEQFHIRFEGRKGRIYNVQVNPYPVFPEHLVIARSEHLPQAIWHHLPDMLDFARANRDYLVYYNGPKSGASAPDHLHFQAIPRHSLPLEEAVDRFLNMPGKALTSLKDASLYHFRGFARGIYAVRATTTKSLAKVFYRMLDCVPLIEGDTEPRFNLYCWFVSGEYRMMVVLRTELRSRHYYSTGDDHLTISPGCAEMAGVFIAPFEEDFSKATPLMLEEMLSDVTVSVEDEKMIDWRLQRTEAGIDVNIASGNEIRFEIISDGAGMQKVSLRDGKIDYCGVLYDEVFFDSVTRSTLFAQPSFSVFTESGDSLSCAGSLRFIVENGGITAVNRIGLENFLLAVLSFTVSDSDTQESVNAEAIRLRTLVSRNPGRDMSFCRYRGRRSELDGRVRKAIDETWGQTEQKALI